MLKIETSIVLVNQSNIMKSISVSFLKGLLFSEFSISTDFH